MPRAIQFTEAHLKAEARPGKRLHVRDTTGLYFDASPQFKNGKITGSWTHRFSEPRHPEYPEQTGGVKEKSLGQYPYVTLDMAKNAVSRARLMMKRDKVNPHRQGVTAELRVGEKTFGEAAKEWLENNRKSWKTDREYHDIAYMFRVHCKALTHKPLVSIRPAVVRAALDQLLKDRPDQKHARKVLEKLELVFNFAKAKQWYPADNPASWAIQKDLFPRLSRTDRAAKHHAAMPFADVPQFIRRLHIRQQSLATTAFALEFCILTGARSGTALGMLWNEVDFDNRLWTIPPGRAQAKTAYRIPLSDRAIAILERQREYRTCDYVFVGRKRQALNERALSNLLREMSEPFTVHGFRSSFRDWVDTLRPKPDFWVAEACLGHVQPKVQRAYLRTDAVEERAAIMESWATYCLGGCPTFC